MKLKAYLYLASAILLSLAAVALTIWGIQHPADFHFGSPFRRQPFGPVIVMALAVGAFSLFRLWFKFINQWIGDD